MQPESTTPTHSAINTCFIFSTCRKLPHPSRARSDKRNLCRAELSPADRASQTARRKAIYLELHPETGHRKATADKDDNLSSFAAATAEAIGKTERAVQRDAERGGLTLGRSTLELDAAFFLHRALLDCFHLAL